MAEKTNVKITIESLHNNERTESIVSAVMYRIGEQSFYYRYEETADGMEGSSTTVKVHSQNNEIKIIRHGSAESEQTFISKRKCQGFYQLPQGRLLLEAYTHHVYIRLEQGLGTVSWTYDLWTQEQSAGTFELKLYIQEEEANECTGNHEAKDQRCSW